MTSDGGTGMLREAAAALAARDDDRALIENGYGFNKSDSWYGHSIAALPADEWTDEIAAHAYRTLRKYAKQLADYGIDFDAIPVPAAPQDEATKDRARGEVWTKMGEKMRKREREENPPRVVIGEPTRVSFPYDPALVAEIKAMPGGRRFDGVTKDWIFDTPSLVTRVALAEWAERNGAVVEGTLVSDAEADKAAEVAEERKVEAAKPPKRVELIDGDRNRVRLIFPYDAFLVSAVKRITGRKFDAESKTWSAPVSAADEIEAFAKEHGFTAGMAVHQVLDSATELRAERREASAALDGTVEIPDEFKITPHPFQRAGIAYAAQIERCFIADEMGLGKTIQALGAVSVKGAYPVFVVCPNNVLKKWARETMQALPGRRVTFLNGKASKPVVVRLYNGDYASIPVNDFTADVMIVNYDKLPRWVEEQRDDEGRVVKKRNKIQWKPVEGSPLDEAIKLGVKAVILDESHYVKNHQAKRTVALQLLAESGLAIRLALSGTPILNRPSELLAQLTILDRLDDLGGFWQFSKRYCGAYATDFGLDLSGGANLPELNDRLREVCLRYDALVATETGPRKIGDLVREGRGVRVWSRSGGGRIELRPAVGFRESIRREPMVEVEVGGSILRCTASHLVWTPQGYKRAASLSRGTHVLVLRAPPDTLSDAQAEPALLLAGVRDQRSGTGNASRIREDEGGPATGDLGRQKRALALDAGVNRENEINASQAEVGTTYARRSHLAGCATATRGSRLAGGVAGVPCSNRGTARKVCFGSAELPLARYSASTVQNGDRSGRVESPANPAATDRHLERGEVGLARVERVEVLDEGSNGALRGDRRRDYLVYDIEVEANGNFFADGVLVHNCYVRRLKKDVLTELPAKQRDSIELPITNRDEYRKAEADVIEWLREQTFNAALLAEMDEEEAEAVAEAKAARAGQAEILARMNYLRQLAARGVLDAAVEWIDEFLDTTGEKLVVWAYHRDIQQALYERLADRNPAKIEAGGDKDSAVQRFQTDDECRVIVCSISAGREGIELTAASNAAFVELEWRPGVHDQAEDRCYGRLDDPHGMNVYYLLAEQTIYADMALLIDEKRVVVDAATDGKVGTTGKSILGSLVGRMTEKAVA